MKYILFEGSQKLGEISDWQIVKQVAKEKNILGKVVVLPIGKDECSFVAPKPVHRKSQLTVHSIDPANGSCEYTLQVISVQGATRVTALIVSQKITAL